MGCYCHADKLVLSQIGVAGVLKPSRFIGHSWQKGFEDGEGYGAESPVNISAFPDF